MSDSQSNIHLFEDDGVILDDRMSEETKKFAKKFVKETNPNKTATLPPHIIRQARVDLVKQLNDAFKFENLLPAKDILIENKYDKYQIPARVYQPKDVRPNAPIIVYYHGGGWTLCSIETHHHACASLASASKTVWISVDYRLAPEHKFNTQLTDYRSSFEWIAANRAQFGVAADAKIGVSGDSAGGHIAALLAHEYKSSIDFQILVYPCVHVSGSHYPSNDEFASDCFVINPLLIEHFKNCYLENDEMGNTELVSPLLKSDFSNMPPCLIIIAQLDPLNGQCLDYHKKLIQTGNRSNLKVIRGTIHGFFSSGFVIEEGFEEAKKEILEFLDTVEKSS